MKQQQYQQHEENESTERPKYVPFSKTETWRRVDPPIMLRGKEVTRYPSVDISEYVDITTGEILAANALKHDRDLWPTIRASERVLQRDYLIKHLRKEVRDFALFVLRFRNQRRGITPGTQKLVKWYALFTGKQACHVRRLVERLYNGGILAGTEVLTPLFMIAGKSVPVREHLCEDSSASVKFAMILLKRRAHSAVGCHPPWEPQCRLIHVPITERCTGVPSSKLRDLRDFINKLVLEGKFDPQFA